jgi:copper chaperone CopZ
MHGSSPGDGEDDNPAMVPSLAAPPADAARAPGPDTRLHWPVQGMTCASCAGRVEKAARATPGVAEASVNLANETLSLLPAAGFDPELLQAALHKAGYEAASTVLTLRVHDMTCVSCVGRVEKALRRESGVLAATVNLATETAQVTLAGEGVSAADRARLLAAVRAAGYGAEDTEAGACCWPWCCRCRWWRRCCCGRWPVPAPCTRPCCPPSGSGCWQPRCSSGWVRASTAPAGRR